LARRTEGFGPWLLAHKIDPSKALILGADIAKEEDVQNAFARVESQWGRLDLLFNNAGIFPTGQLPDEVTGASWRTAVEVNINGAFYCLSAAFSLMKRQSPMGGRIINNGSISAHAPRPASIAYTTTKHAITGLTKAANLDGRAFQIAVGQIDIGNVASDMTQARALAPAHSAPCGAVFILPHAKWSRRVNGVFANELAREAPTRAHAILVDTGAAYLVSVRAPKAAPRGADTLCRGFVTGGGRAAAAGINALPAAEVPRFLAAFDAAFR
jgi:NAD(P)-dependent dehydrogenase (short-subunit alcohol dehydrogenase family)